MKLISAELYNFCQFRYLPVKFAPGLTMIVGRNGSGKSNLVKALYATITGDFGRNEGVKTDNISQFAEASAASKTHVILEHGDSTLDMTRSLRPVATHLRITAPGAKPKIITKAQEATDEVANTLGVSLRMLADYVFVDQWSIFDFLSMMPSERAKAFQRLFRTERAETLWKIIGEHHDNIVIPTPGISKDAVIKRLTENRGQHGLYSRKLEESTAKLISQRPAEYVAVIDNWKRRQTLEKESESLRIKVKGLLADAQDLGIRVTALATEDESLSAYLTNEHDAYLRARESLNNWSTYTAVETNRQRLQSRVSLLSEQIKDHPKPTYPPEYVDRTARSVASEWGAKYQKLEDDLRAAQHFVNLLTEDAPFCPTCGTPAGTLALHRQTYLQQLQTDQKRFNVMRQRLQVSQAYESDMVTYGRVISDMTRERKQLEGQLEQLVTIPKPEKSKQEVEEQVKLYENIDRTYKQTHTDLVTLQRQHEGKTCVIEQLSQDLAHKEAELVTIPVTKIIAEAAQQLLDEHQNLLNEKFEAEVHVRSIADSIRNDELELVQLENVEKTAVAERAWSSHVEDMRHILHRDNLPRLVAQNYLELMQDEINNLLVRFGSTFSVQADESLSFVATFHDGRKIPAGRLSGGEKVLLALAFRVAVNDIFAKDLGLLILDEPTAGLDEGNLGCLRVAIQRLKELSTARGLQVIMITHERDLNNLFDHVIEIGKE